MKDTFIIFNGIILTSLKFLFWRKVEIIYIPLEINNNVAMFFYTYFSVFIQGARMLLCKPAELLHGFTDVTLEV